MLANITVVEIVNMESKEENIYWLPEQVFPLSETLKPGGQTRDRGLFFLSEIQTGEYQVIYHVINPWQVNSALCYSLFYYYIWAVW